MGKSNSKGAGGQSGPPAPRGDTPQGSTGGPPVPPPQAARKRFEIRTPNPGFGGVRGGLRFRDGVAETDDKVLAAELLWQGYQVVDRESDED